MQKYNLLPAKYKKLIMIVMTAVMCILTVIAYREGILTDQDKMNAFLNKCGIFAPLIFAFIQAVQVVFPILPGAIGCVYGVIFWGPFWGFVLNYVGICLGSIWAFLIARQLGQEFVQQVTSKKFYDKYIRYLENEKYFERIFAILIFLPVAPDDFLCYLAGVSRITFKKFTAIILLGKPAAIFLYSMGLHTVFKVFTDFISQKL